MGNSTIFVVLLLLLLLMLVVPTYGKVVALEHFRTGLLIDALLHLLLMTSSVQPNANASVGIDRPRHGLMQAIVSGSALLIHFGQKSQQF